MSAKKRKSEEAGIRSVLLLFGVSGVIMLVVVLGTLWPRISALFQ